MDRESFKPSFSEDLSEDELAKDWSLSTDDLIEVRKCRGEYLKLYFATQLCCLRQFGRFLDHLSIPIKIVNYLFIQMNISPVLIMPQASTNRDQTFQDLRAKIRTYCGFDSFTDRHVIPLQEFLIGLANEGVSREELFQKAQLYLFDKRITPPGHTVLYRIINQAYTRAEKGIFDEILEHIPLKMRKEIDSILEVDEGSGISTLVRYREYPKSPTPDLILDYLDRYDELKQIGAVDLDSTGVKMEVILQFYNLTCSYSAYRLRRFDEKKRYSLVGCFLSEASKMVLDYVIEMNDQYLITVCRKARHAFELECREARRRYKIGTDLAITKLDDLLKEENRSLLIEEWLQKNNPEKILDALEALRSMKTIEERGYYDKLKSRYSKLRRYFPRFCELPFKAEIGGKTILEGIKIFKKMDSDPGLAGLSEIIANQFCSEKQRKILQNSDGEIPRSYCEMLFALEMKEAIRAGQIHLPQSRKNVSFWSMIYDPKVWKKDRDRLYVELSLSPSANEFLKGLSREYEEVVTNFISGVDNNSFVNFDSDGLRLGKVESGKKEIESVKGFLESFMSKIRIEDLLLDLNKKCGFLKEFKPLPGYEARISDKHDKVLLASLVAHGTNLGIAAMGNSTKGITQEELSNTSRYFIRESTLKAANAVIVDYHHSLPITKTWGDGSSSSSDGQRFGVQQSSLLASFYPRYFGHYDRAVTVYTHTSDQYSVFHTNVISCGVREAIYVLDGILENSTDLRPTVHFTDTHGYTEHIFALCHLLGISFMPRIKDIAEQKIYKLHREKDYGHRIESIFSGYIDFGLIEEQWDLIVRIVASLKDKTAPAHLIVGKLARAFPGDRLAKAVTQLGRLVKTIFIFRYLSDELLRNKIQNQLNRGEARHQLAKWLFFANQGEFRSGDYEEMMNKASCLSLLSNSVLVENTLAIAKIIKTNPEAKTVLKSSSLAQVSPLLFRRVIPNGTYHFK